LKKNRIFQIIYGYPLEGVFVPMLGGYQKQGKPLKVLKGLLGFIPTIFKI
jgi:hypothetical protein